MRRTVLSLLLLTTLVGMVFALGGPTVLAQAGVGINVGSIRVDELLTPGDTYHLPPIGVINTGQVPGEYGLTIVYLHKQPEMRPPREWIKFEPARFHLEPGQLQSVTIDLKLPETAAPGDYFAFIEAQRLPSEHERAGGMILGIAAAAKLNFTVETARCDLEAE